MKHLQKEFINELSISQKDNNPFGGFNPAIAIQDGNEAGKDFTPIVAKSTKGSLLKELKISQTADLRSGQKEVVS